MLPRHHEQRAGVAASPPVLFARLDQHDRLAGHMRESSWMMTGGRMRIETDEGARSRLRVFIDYVLPRGAVSHAGWYARSAPGRRDGARAA